MRRALILTNETCNQACGFCTFRRPVENPVFAHGRAVAARIREAIEAGAEEVVLSGGEPTLRKDLPALVAYSRKLGAKAVILESNGLEIDEPLAKALAEAGLSLLRLHMPATGDLYDSIVQVPGAFEQLKKGIKALVGTGIELEAAVPVVKDNSEALASHATALKELIPTLSGAVLRVIDSGDPRHLLELDEAAKAILAFDYDARRCGLSLRLDPGGFIPPCVFPNPVRLTHLYALSRGGANRAGFSRTPECEGCLVADRCPGFPESRLAEGAVLRPKPIVEDRLRRRLTVIGSVQNQIERELTTTDPVRLFDGQIVPSSIVRIRFLCNQACKFCFVSTHLPDPDEEKVLKAIAEVGAQNGFLYLSGGEPTLHPKLVEYVEFAVESGAYHIELQTNATRLATDNLASRLAKAGLSSFFVSFHGSTAEISDAITQAPGTWQQTVEGIEAASKERAQLRLNFVMCRENMEDFPRAVRLVAERWPNASMCFSFVAPMTDLVPRNEGLVPRLSDAKPFLDEGFAIARELGVRMSGLESMCGVPLCLAPESREALEKYPLVSPVDDRGEFLKPEVCQSCAIEPRCWGIRRGYAELYGTEELRPFPLRESEENAGHEKSA